jgi:hypothetical protein
MYVSIPWSLMSSKPGTSLGIVFFAVDEGVAALERRTSRIVCSFGSPSDSVSSALSEHRYMNCQQFIHLQYIYTYQYVSQLDVSYLLSHAAHPDLTTKYLNLLLIKNDSLQSSNSVRVAKHQGYAIADGEKKMATIRTRSCGLQGRRI